MVTEPTLYRSSTTAISDLPFKLTLKEDLWFENVDIFILDNGSYIGDIGSQDTPVLANDIYYSLTPINLSDFFFKNITSGSNTRIVVLGQLLTDLRKKALGIPISFM